VSEGTGLAYLPCPDVLDQPFSSVDAPQQGYTALHLAVFALGTSPSATGAGAPPPSSDTTSPATSSVRGGGGNGGGGSGGGSVADTGSVVSVPSPSPPPQGATRSTTAVAPTQVAGAAAGGTAGSGAPAGPRPRPGHAIRVSGASAAASAPAASAAPTGRLPRRPDEDDSASVFATDSTSTFDEAAGARTTGPNAAPVASPQRAPVPSAHANPDETASVSTTSQGADEGSAGTSRADALAVLRLLLEVGHADTGLRDFEGNFPLHIAARLGHVQAIEMLASHRPRDEQTAEPPAPTGPTATPPDPLTAATATAASSAAVLSSAGPAPLGRATGPAAPIMRRPGHSTRSGVALADPSLTSPAAAEPPRPRGTDKDPYLDAQNGHHA